MCSCIFGWDSFLLLHSFEVQQQNIPVVGVRDVSFVFSTPNISFKMSSKVQPRQSYSLWLFSNTSLYLIVGVDRLDKDLTIGQMQGKYLILLLYPYCNALFG